MACFLVAWEHGIMGWLDRSGCSKRADAGQTFQPLPNDDSSEWVQRKAHCTEKQEGKASMTALKA